MPGMAAACLCYPGLHQSGSHPDRIQLGTEAATFGVLLSKGMGLELHAHESAVSLLLFSYGNMGSSRRSGVLRTARCGAE